MPKTSNIADAQAFARAVAAAGGELPDRLANLIGAYDLLSTPVRAVDPTAAVMDAALAGELTEAVLQKLLPKVAVQTGVNEARSVLAGRAQYVLLSAWHRALEEDNCADAVLDSLRPKFDEHAERIAFARGQFNSESSLEMVIESGSADLAESWRTLPDHLGAVGRIAAIARQFGPRGNFAQITEYALAHNEMLSDTAIMCGAGGVLQDSAYFLIPDQGHRTSPFFRCAGLKLHTIAEAQSRLDSFSAAEFDRVHSERPRGGRVREDGSVEYDEIPENPYWATASVS